MVSRWLRMVLTVTPVLQLGWVGIDLIDSDVIILIFMLHRA